MVSEKVCGEAIGSEEYEQLYSKQSLGEMGQSSVRTSTQHAVRILRRHQP